MIEKGQIRVDQREVLRYLGYKKDKTADEEVLQAIDTVTEDLYRVLDPHMVYGIYPIREVTEDAVDLGFTRITSRNLAKNLSGCKEVVFFVATIGMGVEHLSQRYSCYSMSKAVILQAAAADAIEKYCDLAEEEIMSVLAEGAALRPRFSPGYGDFSLEFQRELFSVLMASKKIGVMLTDSLLMMPSKSVSALIGVGSKDDSKDCVRAGCEMCGKTDCEFRRG